VSSTLEAARRVNASGLVVAAVGFGLTRFTVLDSLRPDVSLSAFLVGEAPVLVAGFGLTGVGLALTVSGTYRTAAPIIARWCLAGTAAMGLVVALTYASVGGPSAPMTESRLVANVLVGGAVGGTLTGARSASVRRHRREARRTADRLTVLNRILRHEVLNKVNVIQGYAAIGDDGERDAWDVIERSADTIGDAVEEVEYLTGSVTATPVALDDHLDEAVASVRATHPDATVAVESGAAVDVYGTARLGLLFEHLLDNAVVHAGRDAPTVRVSVSTTSRVVRVRIVDEGPGIPPAQRRLVQEGTPPAEDDPTTGFGLAIVRLLAEDIGATLSVETPVADGRGTALTVELRRADTEASEFGVPPARLRRGVAASLVAGTVMGIGTQALTGQMAVIGALYGVENAAVGWVTHLFHSAVFGVAFVAATTNSRLRGTLRSVRTTAAASAGYGALLWLVAAGVVMPLWLRAVGVAAPVPNLQPASLVTHLLWGVVFGGVYGWLHRRADDG
jgi:two-component system OmpR family sensor kinase